MAVGYYTSSGSVGKLLADRWNGSSWTLLTVPTPAGATNPTLNGVSCPTTGACMAVGDYHNSAGDRATFAEVWNGTGWTVQGTANAGGKVQTLDAVSCSSAVACMAVGLRSLTGTGSDPLAERWDGAHWTLQSLPVPGGGSEVAVTGVSCPSASDCTAVGHYYYKSKQLTGTFTLVYGWNGSGWSAGGAANPGKAYNGLLSVSCPAANECVATGQYAKGLTFLSMTEVFVGSAWSVAFPPGAGASTILNGVSCSAAGMCTAVGSTGSTFVAPLVERLSGGAWAQQRGASALGPSGATLSAVTCTATNACTAVGSSLAHSGIGFTLVERWNGTSWGLQGSANASAGSRSTALSSISCPAANSCVAVGNYVDKTGFLHAFAEGWNGTSWTVEAVPAPTPQSTLFDVSCSAPGACTAVGTADPNGQGAGYVLAERWNGSSWSVQSAPAQGSHSSFSGVSCPSATACTAVGSYQGSSSFLALAERWNGTSWAVQNALSHSGSLVTGLGGVSCSTTSSCTAVGSYLSSPLGGAGTFAESWDGTKWTIHSTPNSPGNNYNGLAGVSCPSTGACEAVGAAYSNASFMGPLAQGWNGSAWSLQQPSAPVGASSAELLGVWCPTTSACVAVGDYRPGTQPLVEAYSG